MYSLLFIHPAQPCNGVRVRTITRIPPLATDAFDKDPCVRSDPHYRNQCSTKHTPPR